ncbi:CvpA family protein [Chloroflexota bacterium]
MVWVNIIAILILFFSFLGGLQKGAIRNSFSLLVLIIAIPTTGALYYLIATILAFLPGTNWENFIGFFITMSLVTVILYFVFFLPRRIAEKLWKRGVLFRLVGGALNVLSTGIGMVVFTLVLGTYPIINWLAQVVVNASVPVWLVGHLNFVLRLLPETFRQVTTFISIW